MMYMGSKSKVAKHILPILLNARKPGQVYVEPFVGGANMIDKVKGPRIGNDSHLELIEMWKALTSGWVPPTHISKEEYYSVKKCPDSHPPALVAFVGFLCSFGGKWWGGYASNSKGDNYAERASRNLVKQAALLQDVAWSAGSYLDLDIPSQSLIYCDPPYEGTTGYASKFNHVEFWAWVRGMQSRGHDCFVSEYSAPSDFKCLLEMQHFTKMNKNQDQVRIERLFKLEDEA